MKFKSLLIAASMLLAVSYSQAHAAVQDAEVESDSRIRTVVYNENDVFTFPTRHGFQSSIEFGLDETIETISIGDAIGWQITPAGRRIFVKPLQKDGITNLTVITNKHSYQLELVATSSTGRTSNHAYVLRFYYPDEPNSNAVATMDRTRGDLRPVSPTAIPSLPIAPTSYVPPAPIAPALPDGYSNPTATTASAMNYNYSLTGPDSLAPTKIYDDGKSTFLELPKSAEGAKFFVVYADGTEIPATPQQQANLTIIDQLVTKLTIRKDKDIVSVFNEKLLATGQR